MARPSAAQIGAIGTGIVHTYVLLTKLSLRRML